jgi:hypothetical protein
VAMLLYQSWSSISWSDVKGFQKSICILKTKILFTQSRHITSMLLHAQCEIPLSLLGLKGRGHEVELKYMVKTYE